MSGLKDIQAVFSKYEKKQAVWINGDGEWKFREPSNAEGYQMFSREEVLKLEGDELPTAKKSHPKTEESPKEETPEVTNPKTEEATEKPKSTRGRKPAKK